MELQEKIELTAAFAGMFRPTVEISCIVNIASCAEIGVRDKPILVFGKKSLEIIAELQRLPMLFKSSLKIFPLGFQYFRIINKRKCVELILFFFKNFIRFNAQILKIQINRI